MIKLIDLDGTPHFVAASQVLRISGVAEEHQRNAEDRSRVFLCGGSILPCRETPESIYALVSEELAA